MSEVHELALNGPDPHGQAALLLVESLIHGLAEKAILTIPEAIEILEVALGAQVAVLEDPRAPTPANINGAHLLGQIIRSLSADLQR